LELLALIAQRSIPIAQIFKGHDVGTGLIYQDSNIKVMQRGNVSSSRGTGVMNFAWVRVIAA
jgi:hypothetical protein